MSCELAWDTAWGKALRTLERMRPSRRSGAALLIGLALAVAACGPTTSRTATPTPGLCRTWRLIPSLNPTSPAPTEPFHSMLLAVSAVSPTEAWTVGVSTLDDRASRDLIEHWDGAAWHLSTSPQTGALWGMAAVSTNDVWAVGGIVHGSIFDVSSSTTQIVHWNGTQWSLVPSPDPGAKGNNLQGVTASAANDVWAVGGFYDADTFEHALIERWDGTAWHVVASPAPPGAAQSGLAAIARIPGTNQLWAVGFSSTLRDTYPGPADEQTLIERWDGTAWQVVASPALPQGARGSTLRGVVALSPTDAWVVGDAAVSADQPSRPYIAHWNGTAWQAVPSVDTAGSLVSVAASGPEDVRAVGDVFTTGNSHRVLIEQWDGATWRVVTTPNPSQSATGESFLNGITADRAGTFWAVGTARDDVGPAGVFRTVVERCP
jgi:hypothetical protein